MSEEIGVYEVEKKTLKEMLDSPEMEEFRKSWEEHQAQYKAEATEFWNRLSYDDQLKVFSFVVSKIYESDVVERGSYRYCLYDKFSFDMDAYTIGMDCNYLNLHNIIYDGVEFNKFRSAEEVEFRSGDDIHRFPIPKNEWVNVSFDEESNKLIVTTEERWSFEINE